MIYRKVEKMPKFFISDSKFKISDTIEITGNDAHHISKTLRMKDGDELVVTSSDGVDYHCTIEGFSSSSVYLKVCDVRKSEVEGSVKISLFQALAKGDKMETVIQKCIELGVYEIYPVATERCVVKLDQDTIKKKTQRWNKIALEASKQCGRGIVPRVHDTIDFKKCVELLSRLDKRFFCYELEDGKTIKDVISSKGFSTAGFFIGPEGGISPAEVEYAISQGIEAVSLGKLILRTETAGPAVMAMLLYETQL